VVDEEDRRKGTFRGPSTGVVRRERSGEGGLGNLLAGTEEIGSWALKEIEMSELTTMTMAVHKVATLESQHPVHAYDLALEKRHARRARWQQWRSRLGVSARREAAHSSGC
jgi:hypothetical protein